jgi:hydrogenase small subunit
MSQRGISRREFLKFCTVVAGTLALESAFGPRIARALEASKRTPVIWLEFQDCAGCSESFLRASRPTVAEIVLDILSVDYHETIMAASGHLAEEAKAQTIGAGGHLLVVEGSIPTAEDGIGHPGGSGGWCAGRRRRGQLRDLRRDPQGVPQPHRRGIGDGVGDGQAGP